MTTNIENKTEEKINKIIYIIDGDPFYQKWADRLNKIKGVKCELISKANDFMNLKHDLYDYERSSKQEIICIVGDISVWECKYGDADYEYEVSHCYFYGYDSDIDCLKIKFKDEYQLNSYTIVQHLARHNGVNKKAPIILTCCSAENEKKEKENWDRDEDGKLDPIYDWIGVVPKIKKIASMKEIKKAIQQVKNS